MSLIRQQTLQNVEKIRKQIKKSGGDAGDRTNYHDNESANLISAGGNVFDKHVQSYEDFLKSHK